MYMPAAPQHRTSNAILSRTLLAAMFLLFCYVLLTWRATLLTDTAPLLSQRRTLAILAGAGAFWFALKQMEEQERLSLTRAVSWIVAGTILVLLTRLVAEQVVTAAPVDFSYDLRWSLAWGGYFGTWLMGAWAFRRHATNEASSSAGQPTIARAREIPRVSQAEVDWLLEALTPELLGHDHGDRETLADRLLASAGRYELADDADPLAIRHNARVRLAQRLADHIRTG